MGQSSSLHPAPPPGRSPAPSPESYPVGAPDPAAPPAVEPFAMRDLDRALARGRERHGHLLTAGERVVVDRLQACSPPARSLYARLFGRRDRFVALDGLTYAEVPDTGAAAAELEAAGLARGVGMAAARELLALRTVPELRVLCRARGLPTRGRRAALVARLAAGPVRGLAGGPALRLRHRGLVRRLCRAWLVDHAGDLSKLVLARMELLRPPPHPVTGGPGLHRDRRGLRAYEQALAGWGRDPDDSAAQWEAARGALAAMRAPDPARARFTPLPFALRAGAAHARACERAGELDTALAVYAALEAALRRLDRSLPPELSRRAALCEDRAGRGAEGAARCAAALAAADPVSARALARTGRRLARRARQPWRPLPALVAPPVRQLALPRAPGDGPRPLWSVAGARPVPVEAAVAAVLGAHERPAVHSENGVWTSLFALLLWDVIFAPVPGMLPGPAMHRPLDLGLPGFARRRAPQLEAVLAALGAGEGPDRLAAALAAHAGEAVVGLHSWPGLAPVLTAVVAALPGPALAGILGALARDWRNARSGLPDLFVFPGPAGRVPGLFPGRLPAGPLFVEVKAPGDSLRDGQRIWLDRLLGLGLAAELWEVADSTAGGPG